MSNATADVVDVVNKSNAESNPTSGNNINTGNCFNVSESTQMAFDVINSLLGIFGLSIFIMIFIVLFVIFSSVDGKTWMTSATTTTTLTTTTTAATTSKAVTMASAFDE